MNKDNTNESRYCRVGATLLLKTLSGLSVKSGINLVFVIFTGTFLAGKVEAAIQAPILRFEHSQSQATFGMAYNDSITNLTVINTVGHPTYFRAGGDYNDAWTREQSAAK
jgi:hypothetical protein